MEKPKAIRQALKLAWKDLKREQRAGAKSRKPEEIVASAARGEQILVSIKELAQRLAAAKRVPDLSNPDAP